MRNTLQTLDVDKPNIKNFFTTCNILDFFLLNSFRFPFCGVAVKTSNTIEVNLVQLLSTFK